MFDFDTVIDRSGTDSAKWDAATLKEKFGEEEMISCWVADMDFPVAPAIAEAVQKRAAHPIYGYSNSERHIEAYMGWAKRRFNWDVKREWITFTPGVVPALNIAVQTFCHPGEQVMIQKPVYYPFTDAVYKNGCHVVSNDLRRVDDHYEIDFDDFEAKAKDPRTTLFIMCSPHNPAGRLWTEDELRKMMTICLENNVFVISDEIHSDLVLPGHKHHVAASLSPEIAQNVMTCTAPSKTFNLAGMQFSTIIIPNEAKRREFQQAMDNLTLLFPNPFAIVSVTAAYEEGEPWLEELLTYLQGNLDWINDYVAKNMPKIKVFPHEATYLLWMDCSALGLNDQELQDVMYHDAKVAMDAGSWFGPQGEGFMRFNMATQRSRVQAAFEAIHDALDKKGLL